MAALISRNLSPFYPVCCHLKLEKSHINAPCPSLACSSSVGVGSKASSSLQLWNGRRTGWFFWRRSKDWQSRRCLSGKAEKASWGKGHRRVGEVFARGTDDSFSTGEMNLEDALKLLGIGDGASFDEILGAKKTLVDSSGGDQDRISQLEAAYDTLLMQSLSQRRSGKVLDSSIRYADVTRAKSLAVGGPDWFKVALQKSPVTLQTPPTDTIALQTGVYGALIVWTLASGLASSNVVAATSGADTPSLILAAGFGVSLYFLRKQNVRLGKAFLITIGGLVVGAVFGGLVESWLRVDIVPFGGISSPAAVVSEFVLVSLYLSSLYLR